MPLVGPCGSSVPSERSGWQALWCQEPPLLGSSLPPQPAFCLPPFPGGSWPLPLVGPRPLCGLHPTARLSCMRALARTPILASGPQVPALSAGPSRWSAGYPGGSISHDAPPPAQFCFRPLPALSPWPRQRVASVRSSSEAQKPVEPQQSATSPWGAPRSGLGEASFSRFSPVFCLLALSEGPGAHPLHSLGRGRVPTSPLSPAFRSAPRL